MPALAASGGKCLDPFLFETLAQLGFAPPLLPVALLPLTQFAMKGAVVLARARGHKVGNPHIDANHRRRWLSLDWYHLIVTECQPPTSVTLIEGNTGIEGNAGIEGLAFHCLAMIGC